MIIYVYLELFRWNPGFPWFLMEFHRISPATVSDVVDFFPAQEL